MVLATLAFLEDATDREGFPDKELVSLNLSSWNKKKIKNLRVISTGKVATQVWVFFLKYIFALGNDKGFSVLNPLFIRPNGFPWLLSIQLMQRDSESLGREKEWGGGTWIISTHSLPYHYSKCIFIFETDMTPRTAFLGCHKHTQMHNIC